VYNNTTNKQKDNIMLQQELTQVTTLKEANRGLKQEIIINNDSIDRLMRSAFKEALVIVKEAKELYKTQGLKPSKKALNSIVKSKLSEDTSDQGINKVVLNYLDNGLSLPIKLVTYKEMKLIIQSVDKGRVSKTAVNKCNDRQSIDLLINNIKEVLKQERETKLKEKYSSSK
jgi:hypothetical protein